MSVMLKAGTNPFEVRVSKTVVKAATMLSPFVDCIGRAKMYDAVPQEFGGGEIGGAGGEFARVINEISTCG